MPYKLLLVRYVAPGVLASDNIECLIFEWQVEGVPGHDSRQKFDTLRLGPLPRVLDICLDKIDPGNLTAKCRGKVPGWPTDSASDIEYAAARRDTGKFCEFGRRCLPADR